MKKLCFITAARSEYGLLKWLMYDISKGSDFKLQLIVTGGHLLEEQGHTIDQIIKDGFEIDAVVDAQLNTKSEAVIAASMGRMAESLADALEKLKPDYLVVLGDRYELLSICSTAFIMRIPIIHLSGGDVTEGLIDNGVRNAVTMLADYHFPGTKASMDNIVRMRGSSKNVWTVGEPGLDAYFRETLYNRQELADMLGLDCRLDWILFTYHAVTSESLEINLAAVENCFQVLLELGGVQVVATYANADFGGRYINEMLEQIAKDHPSKITVIASLGTQRYLSLMRQAKFIIGNSSSGIVEAPMLKVPVVDLGERQSGRYKCVNIISCKETYDSIQMAVLKAMKLEVHQDDLDYWGDGRTSRRINDILVETIKRKNNG